MKGKTKLKTIEEIPLEEVESQVRVESEFIIYCMHMMHSLCNIDYVTQHRKCDFVKFFSFG